MDFEGNAFIDMSGKSCDMDTFFFASGSNLAADTVKTKSTRQS